MYHELDGKPFDRELLTRFANELKSRGQVCDMGCGPGHVACFLQSLGVDVFGLDVSPGMVELARRLNPAIRFETGDMLALDLPTDGLAGIAAFYSIVNISKKSLAVVFREMFRVLRVDGLLLLAFHIGDEAVHLDELWDHPVLLDFFFLQPAEIHGLVEAAGFEIEEVLEREPYAPEIEHQSRRAYIWARKKSKGA